jgi:hypothetical protein
MGAARNRVVMSAQLDLWAGPLPALESPLRRVGTQVAARAPSIDPAPDLERRAPRPTRKTASVRALGPQLTFDARLVGLGDLHNYRQVVGVGPADRHLRRNAPPPICRLDARLNRRPRSERFEGLRKLMGVAVFPFGALTGIVGLPRPRAP